MASPRAQGPEFPRSFFAPSDLPPTRRPKTGGDTIESSDTPDARQHVYQVRVNVPPDAPLGMYAEIMALPSTLRPRYARDLMLLGLAFTWMVNGAGAMADALQQVSTTHAPTSAYPATSPQSRRCAALRCAALRLAKQRTLTPVTQWMEGMLSPRCLATRGSRSSARTVDAAARWRAWGRLVRPLLHSGGP